MANKATDYSRANRKAAVKTARQGAHAAETEALAAYYAEHPDRAREAREAMVRMLDALRGGRTQGGGR